MEEGKFFFSLEKSIVCPFGVVLARAPQAACFVHDSLSTYSGLAVDHQTIPLYSLWYIRAKRRDARLAHELLLTARTAAACRHVAAAGRWSRSYCPNIWPPQDAQLDGLTLPIT